MGLRSIIVSLLRSVAPSEDIPPRFQKFWEMIDRRPQIIPVSTLSEHQFSIYAYEEFLKREVEPKLPKVGEVQVAFRNLQYAVEHLGTDLNKDRDTRWLRARMKELLRNITVLQDELKSAHTELTIV